MLTSCVSRRRVAQVYIAIHSHSYSPCIPALGIKSWFKLKCPALPLEFQKCENLVLSEECYHKDDIINIVNLNFHYFYFQLSQSVEKKRALNQGSHFHLQSISEIKPKSMLPVAQECFFFSHFFLFFISISKNIIYMVITMTYQNYHTQKRTYFQGFLCSSKKSLLWKGKS